MPIVNAVAANARPIPLYVNPNAAANPIAPIAWRHDNAAGAAAVVPSLDRITVRAA